jgi:tetratricopeptide (TPR) repeat protein
MGDEQSSVAVPPAVSTEGTPFRYDVFVSYSHKDAAWVRNDFLAQLRNAGLKVLIDTEFEVGVPSVQNMTRALEEARHVVIVLTPNWVAGEWTAFESYLFATADPVGRQRRVLPLMLEPCKPPPHIAFLTYADFIDAGKRAEEMERLLRAMKTQENLNDALPIRTKYASEYAREGLQALADLMQDADVRDTVAEFKTVFRDTRRQVEVVYNYKDLHDQLHDIQLLCYDPIVRETERFPADRLAVGAVTNSRETLESRIASISEITQRADYLASERADLISLQQALATYDAALTNLDTALLKKATQKLSRVMTLQPSRVNAKLVAAAGNLHLESLVAAMQKISQRLTELHAHAEKVQQFSDGVRALETLHAALTALIQEHDLWQVVDTRFNLLATEIEQEVDSLGDSWNDVRQIAAPLYEKKLEAWAEKYRLLEERLLKAIAEHNPNQARMQFDLCRGRAVERFYQVDVSLKRSCENLRKIGEPLAAVLHIL